MVVGALSFSLLALCASPGDGTLTQPPSLLTATGPATSVVVRAVDVPAATALVSSLGGTVGAALPIVDGFAAEVPESAVDTLRAEGLQVDLSVPLYTMGSYGQDSGDVSAVYPSVTNAGPAHADGYDGSGVSVAIIDTGIDDSGELAGRVIGGYDFTGENDYTKDSYGHGTFVAGFVAGSGAASAGAITGEAPGADLVSLKIAGADGKSDLIRVLAALQWTIANKDAHNIKVLNLSLGMDSAQNWKIDPLNAAVERAWRAGIVVTVAAGNLGPTSGTITKPGDDPFVITVGSIDDATTLGTQDDYVPPFSSTGPTRAGLVKPDIAAPGSHLVSLRVPGSTVDTKHPEARVEADYFRGSGTSFSSAIVAGAAAMVIQANPGITPDQVKGRLLATAVPTTYATPNQTGKGLLDASAAVSTPAPPANVGAVPASPIGSLQASRGSSCLKSSPGSSSCLPESTVNFLMGLQSSSWQSSSWQSSSWQSLAWLSSSWQSSSWQSISWQSSSWQSSSWQSSSWQSSSWQSSSWQSSSWMDATWWSSSWQ